MNKGPLLIAAMLTCAVQAQVTESITIGPGYGQQLWYSLQNGTTATGTLNDWDLAFEIPGFTASILVNTAKAGLEVYRSPFAVGDWSDVDTAGIATWTMLHNSDTSWSIGALNQGSTGGEFDLGWGDYNSITHAVVGDSIYVVRTASGAWRKLRIDGLISGTYSLTHAALDGSDERTGAVQKSLFAGRNFAYYDLGTDAAIDREPASTAWDLLFTKYVTFIPQPYGVSGVLHNRTVQAVRVTGLPHNDATYDHTGMATAINTIGYDWKSYNMTTFQWELDEELTFFVKDGAGNIWKLYFTGFGGSANGEFTFVKEMVSATGLYEPGVKNPVLHCQPNPVRDGRTQLVVDLVEPLTTLRVFDGHGREMRSQGLQTGAGLTNIPVDLSGLSPGLYLLRLDGATTSAVTRVVVE